MTWETNVHAWMVWVKGQKLPYISHGNELLGSYIRDQQSVQWLSKHTAEASKQEHVWPKLADPLNIAIITLLLISKHYAHLDTRIPRVCLASRFIWDLWTSLQSTLLKCCSSIFSEWLWSIQFIVGKMELQGEVGGEGKVPVSFGRLRIGLAHSYCDLNEANCMGCWDAALTRFLLVRKEWEKRSYNTVLSLSTGGRRVVLCSAGCNGLLLHPLLGCWGMGWRVTLFQAPKYLWLLLIGVSRHSNWAQP